MGALVLALPVIVLSFLAVVAAISGCIAGYFANMLLIRINKVWIKQDAEKPTLAT